MHDADKPAQAQFHQTELKFLHPPGFKVGAFLIVAVDENGQQFSNIPPEPAMALFLANTAVSYTTKQAIAALQKAAGEESLIAKVPPGMQLPTWRGPAGRG